MSGQAFSCSGSVSGAWSKNVAGYEVNKTLSVFKDQYCPEWYVDGSKDVTSTYTGRWTSSSIRVGSDHGTKYVQPYFSWGRGDS